MSYGDTPPTPARAAGRSPLKPNGCLTAFHGIGGVILLSLVSVPVLWHRELKRVAWAGIMPFVLVGLLVGAAGADDPLGGPGPRALTRSRCPRKGRRSKKNHEQPRRHPERTLARPSEGPARVDSPAGPRVLERFYDDRRPPSAAAGPLLADTAWT